MQAHRGPDDVGVIGDSFAALGANRLAIMDPSPRGHMPMAAGDDWLVFNGEIYNHVELRTLLRDRGQQVASGGDTEVLLRCLQEFGLQCLPMLRGMFAFAWWNGADRRLVLARDRIGIKPLAYRLDAGVLSFASESKVLGWQAPAVDPEALAAYLVGTRHPSRHTFFCGVMTLPPGTYGVLKGDALDISPYWQLPGGSDEAQDGPTPTEDEIDDLIVGSVRMHLRSDVPVGAYLSGGLDSSLVASIAAAELGSLPTFSANVEMTDRRFDERPWVARALERIPGEHHRVTIDPETWWADLLSMAWFLDEPTAGPAGPAHYAVSRLAADHVKVVLGGQGGDELFGGYYRHLWAHAKDLVSSRDVLHLAQGVPSMARVVGDLGPRVVVGKFRRGSLAASVLMPDVAEALPEVFEPTIAESQLARLQRWDLTEYLPKLLHVEDRASMAASVESRVPLLDHELMEAAWPISGTRKLPGFRLKGLLRRVAARHVAPAIAARGDKRGFPMPIGPWFADPLYERVAEVLDTDAVDRHGVFDRRELRSLLDRHRSGSVDASAPLWSALSVELWFATFVDRVGDSPLTA